MTIYILFAFKVKKNESIKNIFFDKKNKFEYKYYLFSFVLVTRIFKILFNTNFLPLVD